jgi:hypothetical protein
MTLTEANMALKTNNVDATCIRVHKNTYQDIIGLTGELQARKGTSCVTVTDTVSMLVRSYRQDRK